MARLKRVGNYLDRLNRVIALDFNRLPTYVTVKGYFSFRLAIRIVPKEKLTRNGAKSGSKGRITSEYSTAIR